MTLRTATAAPASTCRQYLRKKARCSVNTSDVIVTGTSVVAPPMALNRTLPAFAAERRLKAPAAIDRYLLQTPALSSKPLLLSIDGTDRRTDGRMDARPLHRPCSAHYAGSISNVHCRTLRQADTLVYADDEQGGGSDSHKEVVENGAPVLRSFEEVIDGHLASSVARVTTTRSGADGSTEQRLSGGRTRHRSVHGPRRLGGGPCTDLVGSPSVRAQASSARWRSLHRPRRLAIGPCTDLVGSPSVRAQASSARWRSLHRPRRLAIGPCTDLVGSMTVRARASSARWRCVRRG